MYDVLLVEDDPSVADPLAVALDREGYRTEVQGTAKGALAAVVERPFDLMILDLGLPDSDGLHVCREIRRMDHSGLPILVLTARAEEIDVVVGLDSGADDYLAKPFRLAELMARMRALIRRTAPTPTLVVGPLRVDVDGRRAWLDGDELDLAPKEFDTLSVLARHSGTVVSRAQLAREVWNDEIEHAARTIDTHVSAIRRKLAVGRAPIAVTTIRRTGFRLEAR